MAWPILVAALASSDPPRNELSIALAHCFCVINENKMDGDFGLVSVVGFRGDYAFRVGGGIRVGASAAIDWLADDERDQAWLARFGPTLAGRWGRTVQGGIRVGAGYARGDDGKTGRLGDGWYFDSDAEIAGKLSPNAELFIDIAIISLRNLRYPGTGYYGGYEWGYTALPFPPSVAIGARWLL